MSRRLSPQGTGTAIRRTALTLAAGGQNSLGAAELHGKRQDMTSQARRIRERDPLTWLDPSLQSCDFATRTDTDPALDLRAAYAAWTDGCGQHGKLRHPVMHNLIQFPTGIALDPAAEQRMLDHAVAFVNRMQGGDAVFAARLDRDEAGRHTVDVFSTPRYWKTTKARSGPHKGQPVQRRMIASTRFDHEMARKPEHRAELVRRLKTCPRDLRVALGYPPLPASLTKDQDTEWRTRLLTMDESAARKSLPVGPRQVGQVLQTEWETYLRAIAPEFGLDPTAISAKTEKTTPDADRLEPEIYKLNREAEAAESRRRAVNQELGTATTRLATVQQEITTLTDTLADLRSEAQRLARETEEAATLLEQTQKSVTTATAAVTALDNDKTALTRTVTDLTGQRDQLTQEVAAEQRRLDAIQAKIADPGWRGGKKKDRELAGREITLDEREREVAALETTIAQRETKIKDREDAAETRVEVSQAADGWLATALLPVLSGLLEPDPATTDKWHHGWRPRADWEAAGRPKSWPLPERPPPAPNPSAWSRLVGLAQDLIQTARTAWESQWKARNDAREQALKAREDAALKGRIQGAFHAAAAAGCLMMTKADPYHPARLQWRRLNDQPQTAAAQNARRALNQLRAEGQDLQDLVATLDRDAWAGIETHVQDCNWTEDLIQKGFEMDAAGDPTLNRMIESVDGTTRISARRLFNIDPAPARREDPSSGPSPF